MTKRRAGHSALRWDKEAQALTTFDPHPSIYQEKRPAGSNADEWHLFLCRYLDNRAMFPTGLSYVAVQIAEAIDQASRSLNENASDPHPDQLARDVVRDMGRGDA